MNVPSTVVSIHQTLGISGVTVAGARMASIVDAPFRVIPMVVGADVTPDAVAASALGACEDVEIASWHAGATPMEQVAMIRDALARLKPEVVCAHDCVAGHLAAASLSHAGVRTLLWHHSSGPDGDDVIVAAGRLADAFVAVSRELSSHASTTLAELPAPAIDAAPVYVDVPAIPEARVPGVRTLRLVYCGRLERRHKNVLDLARLADALRSREVRFFLTIAGDGPARAELEEALAVHLDAGRVLMLGEVSADRARGLYGAHDVGVLVSRCEGMPLAVSECMAAGRPVAITDGCGGAVEAVIEGENGWVVPVGDMEALADRLAKIATQREKLIHMGRAAHRTATSRWSLEALEPAYERMIAAALQAPMRVVDADSATRQWNSMMHAAGFLASSEPGDEAASKASEASLARLRDAWIDELRQQGVRVDRERLECRVPRVLRSSARRLASSLDALVADGCRRIAVYGAGAHTREAIGVVRASSEIVCIVDDAPSVTSLGGVPVVGAERAASMEFDAVIVSSVEHEEAMLLRASRWAGSADVVGLYSPAPITARRAA